MHLLVLLNIFIFTEIGFAEDLDEKLECHKTLTSSVADQYNPRDGYFVCDGRTKKCFLIDKKGESFVADLPSKATYVINEIEHDMAYERQPLEHRLIFFYEPISKKKVSVDVFWGKNKRAFARNLIQVKDKVVDEIKFSKTNLVNLNSLISKRIQNQLNILEKNIKNKTGQPGYTLEDWKKSWSQRLSGCKNDKRALELQKSI